MRIRTGVFLTSFLLAIAEAPGSAARVSPGAPLWTAYDLVSNYHNPDAIAVSPDAATVYVAGKSGRGNVAVVAYDSLTGARRWVTQGHPGGPVDLVASERGTTVYLAGSTRRPRDVVVQAFRTSDGAARWTVTYDGPAHETDTATALAIDAERVYVAAQSRTEEGDRDIAILAVERATGARAWVRRYGGTGSETTRSLVVRQDLLFAGGWTREGDAEHPLVLASHGATGERAWTWTGEPPGRVRDVVAAGELIVATGTGRSNEGREAPTFALRAATGVEVWRDVRELDLWSIYPVDIGVAPDGASVFVTARTRPYGTWTPERYGSDAVTWSLSASDGALRWQRVIDRGDYDVPRGLSVAAEGGWLAIAGASSFEETDPDHMTIVLEQATGAVRWIRIHPRTFPGLWTQDILWDVAFSPDGSRVFATGEGYTPNAESRWVTRAYRT